MAKNMLSAERFIEELKKRGGSEKRSDLLLRWKNGEMTAAHLNALILETGCTCASHPTGGRFKVVVSLPTGEHLTSTPHAVP
jgi:hypothetical protein